MTRGTFLDYLLDENYSTTHGSSKFAGYWEQRKLLKKSNSGIYLANNLRLSPDDSFKHLILISPTGSGKTTKFILNNSLRKWNKNSSLVFFDPSSEIYNLSEKWLKKQNFYVKKIDFIRPETEKNNPLDQVYNKSTARIVAQSLINAIYEDSKGDIFWTESAIAALTLIILGVVKKIPRENRTLSFVNRLVNKFEHSQEEIDVLMQEALSDDDFDEYASFMSNSDKVKKSITATLRSALYIYSDENLKRISSQSSFNFAELRERKTALFLIQESHQVPYFKGWWSLFFRQMFEYLMTSDTGNNVYVFADEFANFGKIPDMDVIMATIRKKRVSINIILQSYAMLENVYNPQKAQIIFQNAYSKMFLSGLSNESAKIVSDMLGQTTESYSSKGIFKRNQQLYRTSRNLLNPDEVRTLDEKYCLLISGNYKPMKLEMKPFYKNRKLRKRSKL